MAKKKTKARIKKTRGGRGRTSAPAASASGRQSVKVIRAALDVIEVGDEEHLILRGVIDPDSLELLKVDDYQREILNNSKKVEEFEAALSVGEVPDIDLGMRGDSLRATTDGDGEVYYLHNSVFIVDGLQRVTAAKNLLAKKSGVTPRLGATIHLNTTKKWERERFHVLNTARVRVNANITLRNMSPDLKSVALLIRMTTKEKDCVLHGKVSWQQRMRRGQLITAVTMLKALGRLHAHIGPGKATNVEQLANGWEKIFGRVGPRTIRHNIKEFFDTVERCWGISLVTYGDRNPQITLSFLMTLGRVFSEHEDFWDGNKLVVPKSLAQKLAMFAVMDPHIAELCSASGSSRDILFNLLVQHINKGKRTRHLTPRDVANVDDDEDESGGEEEFDSESDDEQ